VKLLSTATVKGKTVTESPAGWFDDKTAECISDAVLRIEQVVCNSNDDSDPYYKGHILYGDLQIPFLESMAVVDKNPGYWMKKKVLADEGKLIVVKQGWNAHLLDIARQFYEPEVVREDGKFGWKTDDACFALPHFSVQLGGTVTADDAHVVDDIAPGRALPAPGPLPADTSMLLQDTPSNQVFWATAACLGANILAPAVGQPYAAVGLLGHGSLLNGRAAARAFGCYEFELGTAQYPSASRAADRLEVILSRHSWPVCTRTSNGNVLRVWINGDYTRNVVAHLDPVRADVAAIVDAWRFVRCDTAVSPGPEIQMYGPGVVTSWLKRLCENKLQLRSQSELYAFRVLDDLADMMAQFGDTEIIRKASALLDDASDDQDRGKFVASLLYRFIEAGNLRYEQAGGSTPKLATPAIIRIDDGSRAPGIFVPRKPVMHAIDRRGITTPDPGRITTALRIAGALDCECEYNGEAGWFIIESWWNRQIDLCRAQYHSRLKVIGGA
jgi:hypothetical protein